MAVRKNSSSGRRRRRDKGFAGILIVSASILAASVIASRSRQAPAPEPVKPTIVAEFDTVEIPVPVEMVPIGTKISDVRFKKVAFPRHQVPEGALKAVGPVMNAVTLAPLPANLPVFRANLSLNNAGSNPVVERIPKGMRAMTVSVDATSAVEGWAGSGAIVDVLLVQKEHTSVVAEKVKILSAERSIEPVEGSSAPHVPKTVTLLVTQDQCLAINTAIPLGKIAFALRGSADEESWSEASYSADQLKRGTGSSPVSSEVTGYASVKDETRKRSFALSDGKWIPTDVVPEGFFAAEQEDAEGQS